MDEMQKAQRVLKALNEFFFQKPPFVPLLLANCNLVLSLESSLREMEKAGGVSAATLAELKRSHSLLRVRTQQKLAEKLLEIQDLFDRHDLGSLFSTSPTALTESEDSEEEEDDNSEEEKDSEEEEEEEQEVDETDAGSAGGHAKHD